MALKMRWNFKCAHTKQCNKQIINEVHVQLSQLFFLFFLENIAFEMWILFACKHYVVCIVCICIRQEANVCLCSTWLWENEPLYLKFNFTPSNIRSFARLHIPNHTTKTFFKPIKLTAIYCHAISILSKHLWLFYCVFHILNWIYLLHTFVCVYLLTCQQPIPIHFHYKWALCFAGWIFIAPISFALFSSYLRDSVIEIRFDAGLRSTIKMECKRCPELL